MRCDAVACTMTGEQFVKQGESAPHDRVCLSDRRHHIVGADEQRKVRSSAISLGERLIEAADVVGIVTRGGRQEQDVWP